MKFTEPAVASWMRQELTFRRRDYQEPGTDLISTTALAEAAANAFGVADPAEPGDEPSPLDDETHWIWEVAWKVGDPDDSAANLRKQTAPRK